MRSGVRRPLRHAITGKPCWRTSSPIGLLGQCFSASRVGHKPKVSRLTLEAQVKRRNFLKDLDHL